MRRSFAFGGLRRLPALLTLTISLSCILCLGEFITRIAVPKAARAYFESYAAPGPFQPDPDISVAYRSFEALSQSYAERFSELAAGDGRPTWLLMGNSFVQAPGMLGDTAATALPGRHMFYLKRNEILPVRVAQVEQLLANGLKPERIIFTLLPVDMLQLGRRSLDQVAVAANGGLFTRMVRPDFWPAWLLESSHLAAIAWIQTGRADSDRDFSRPTIHDRPSARIMTDIERLLGRLSTLSLRYETPITILLVPSYDQIIGRSGFGMQDAVAEAATRLKLDVAETRSFFLGAQNPQSMFVPDLHFSARGNALLLDGLLAHLRAAGLRDLPAMVK